MNSEERILDEESLISEITIQPDGRVYLFGASRQTLGVLETLNPQEGRICLLLQHIDKANVGRALPAGPALAGSSPPSAGI